MRSVSRQRGSIDAINVLWYHRITMGSLPPAALIIVVAALSALAGAVLAWLIIYLTHDRGPERKGKSSGGAQATDVDLLRVVASKSGPTVVIRGERLHHLREIRDRETGEEAVTAVKAVLAFAEGWLPALREEGNPPDVSGTLNRSPVRGAAQPPQQHAPAASAVGSGSTADPLRLVEEIDRLLQRRLDGHPEFAEEGIRLTRDVEDRLLIYVGQDRYRSAGEIPDDDIAQFIRETIQIWERM